MALITCPECGKKISEKAIFCVGCGIPMYEIRKMSSASASVKDPEINKKGSLSEIKTDLSNRTIKCSICGSDFALSDRFCPKCRFPVFCLSGNPDVQGELIRQYKTNAGFVDLRSALAGKQQLEFGRYKGEPLTWSVIKRDQREIILLCDKALGAMYEVTAEIAAGNNLFGIVNYSKNELAQLSDPDICIRLLKVSEAREIAKTNPAIKSGIRLAPGQKGISGWWLQKEDGKKQFFTAVTSSGQILDRFSKTDSLVSLALRPVIVLKAK